MNVSPAVSGRSAACLFLAAALLLPVPTAARQDWKASARESFDLVWKTVNESYYDPTFGGLDWAAVRDELRPKLDAAVTPEGARAVIRDMLRRLGRSHFTLIAPSPDPWPGPATLPLEFRIMGDRPVVTRVEDESSAWKAGIREGDTILAVDGQDAAEGVAETGGSPLSQHLVSWQRIFRLLHGSPDSVVDLRLLAASGGIRSVTLRRSLPVGDVVTLGNLPPLSVRMDAREVRTPGGRRVGVIAFSAWMTTVGGPFADAVDRFRQADAIVVDLRGNPGGLAEMIRGISGHFLAAPDLLGRVQMRGADLEFRANPRRSTSDGRRVEPYSGPLALLVDEMTASASECFAGGMQSLGRARVFGSRTAGQALPASTRQLPNGDVLLYAIGDFVTSTGVRLEGAGVVPDSEVPLSPPILAARRDPVLAMALDWVDRSKADAR